MNRFKIKSEVVRISEMYIDYIDEIQIRKINKELAENIVIQLFAEINKVEQLIAKECKSFTITNSEMICEFKKLTNIKRLLIS